MPKCDSNLDYLKLDIRGARKPESSGAEALVVFQDRVQQHLRSGRALLERRALGLIVAEAAEAGDEDHRRRRHPRDIGGVVTGAGDHVAGGKADLLDAVRARRRCTPDRTRPPASPRPLLVIRRADLAATLGRRRKSSRSITSSTASSGWRKSTVKKTSPGITLRRIGRDLDQADRADGAGRMLQGDPIHRSIDPRCPEQSILAQDASASRRYARPARSPSISYQRIPCTPVTTPITFCSASRIGPCSIWSSNMAPNLAEPDRLLAAIADALELLAEASLPSRSWRLSAKLLA